MTNTTDTTGATHTFLDPDGLHDPAPFGYSHTAAVPAGADTVLVAGQYASDLSGDLATTDFAGQVERALDNLATALAGHGLGLEHVAFLRTYVVDHDVDRLGAIGAAIGARWGSTPPAQTQLGVARLALPGLEFEVEAVAVRPR